MCTHTHTLSPSEKHPTRDDTTFTHTHTAQKPKRRGGKSYEWGARTTTEIRSRARLACFSRTQTHTHTRLVVCVWCLRVWNCLFSSTSYTHSQNKPFTNVEIYYIDNIANGDMSRTRDSRKIARSELLIGRAHGAHMDYLLIIYAQKQIYKCVRVDVCVCGFHEKNKYAECLPPKSSVFSFEIEYSTSICLMNHIYSI